MDERQHFQYLFFRLAEYVDDELPPYATTAEIAKYEEDVTMLSFLAHRALVHYPVKINAPKGNRKLVDFSVAKSAKLMLAS